MTDEEVREKAETLIEIDQKMVNQKDPLRKIKKVILLEMTEESKGASDVVKRITLKETA